jgi:hypothetical protein
LFGGPDCVKLRSGSQDHAVVITEVILMHARILLLAALLCVASVAMAAPHHRVVRHAAARVDPLNGAWELYGPSVGEGLREVKFISASRFHWTTWDTTSHEVVACGGGRSEHQGDVYFERLEYSQGSTGSLVGTLLAFRTVLRGDTLIQLGMPGSALPGLYEVWVRAR